MENNEANINNLVAYKSGFNSGYSLGKLNKSQRMEKAMKSIAEKNPYDAFCFGLLKGFHEADREKLKSTDRRMDDLKNISKNKSKDKDLER